MEERPMDMPPPEAGVAAFAQSAWYACPGEPCHDVAVRVIRLELHILRCSIDRRTSKQEQRYNVFGHDFFSLSI